MRKVAGSLRLDLAAYRELEAFAQLGTELDPSTQAKLDRGARMVELLKQPQYQTMHVADQILSLYTATKGFMDKIPVEKISDFESTLLTKIRDSHSEVRQQVMADKVISDELAPELNKIIEGIREAFLQQEAHDPR
jgi:F-type H+-transporting ATPase subunit alpha